MLQLLPRYFYMKPCAKEDLKVLYLDNHLFAVDKPAGILTQPDNSQHLNLEKLAKEFLKERFKKESGVFLHAVHRLDKEVSGIVLFARSSKALSRLNEALRNNEIKRTYFAHVEGHFKIKRGILLHYLKHDSHRASISACEKEGYKRAELFFEVMNEKKDSSLIKVELVTGRYHQIRAQLSFVGHPIIGDKKYGGRENERLLLHHAIMELLHPVKKEKIILKSLCDLG